MFVRALDALEPVAITGGTSLRRPFIAPDGQWVGFVDVYTLKKMAIGGGPAVAVAALDSCCSRGATWLPDDSIVFATSNFTTGLQRVSAGGGTPVVLTRADQKRGEADHLWPEALPGGRAVLFTITAQSGGLDAVQVAVLDLRTNTSKILIPGGSHGHYVRSGHLVYAASGTLRAVPFNLDRLEVRGPPVTVVPRLVTATGEFDIAGNGTLVYADAPGALAPTARTLVWVDRSGKEQLIPAPPRDYQQPRVSPDGTRIALYVQRDIWVWDLRRQTLTRVTDDPANDVAPVWTPDSRRLIFSSDRAGVAANLWVESADGAGAAERLTSSSNNHYAHWISSDGRDIIVEELSASTGRDLMLLKLGSSPVTSAILQTKSEDEQAALSPDGRWLAYDSNSSGRFEVYVRPFPNVAAGQSQVSTAGGKWPLWARSGRELFFFGEDGALMRVAVEASGATWNAGPPSKLLEPRYFGGGSGITTGRTYDISADDQRFVMIKPPSSDQIAAPPTVILVQHWDEELKRLVPGR